MAKTGTNAQPGEPSTSELIRQLTDQTTRLARQEVALAKAELAVKGKQAGLGAGMFGGAGLFGLYALGALTAAAILALATAVEGWLAAAIVCLVYAAIAGILALVAKGRVRQATPPLPEQAIDSAKEDVEWTKQRVKASRQ
jgi:tetrahydromethanopterin S-methyltransferase subunit C